MLHDKSVMSYNHNCVLIYIMTYHPFHVITLFIVIAKLMPFDIKNYLLIVDPSWGTFITYGGLKAYNLIKSVIISGTEN